MPRNLEAMIEEYEKNAEELPKLARQKVDTAMAFLTERVKATVPIETGTLQSTVHYEVEEHKGEITGSIIAGGPKALYALDVHENPARKLDGSTPEGGRGPKYMTRVFDYHMDLIDRIGEETFNEVFKK